MSLKFVQPIDGSAAYLEDEKGRKLRFPAPASDPDYSLGAESKIFGSFGEVCEYGVNSEEITLATDGLTTDSSANLLPAGSEILGVVARVTTTITVTSSWAVGDGTTAARFSAANSTLTAGTTSIGLAHRQPDAANAAAGPVQASAAKVRITCADSNPGAGKIRVSVFYRKYTAPTS